MPIEKMSASTTTTLGQVRHWLRDHLLTGAVCPACGQLAKMYKRPLNAAMATFLVRAYRAHGTAWFHAPSWIRTDSIVAKAVGVGGEHSKTALWGLAEESSEIREDGGRAGWWRITLRGEDFVNGRVTVPKYALVYNAEGRGHEGEQITVHDALGTKFNLRDLMSGLT